MNHRSLDWFRQYFKNTDISFYVKLLLEYVEALEAKITQLDGERNLVRVAGDIKTEQWEKAQARAEKAETQLSTMRKALQKARNIIAVHHRAERGTL